MKGSFEIRGVHIGIGEDFCLPPFAAVSFSEHFLTFRPFVITLLQDQAVEEL